MMGMERGNGLADILADTSRQGLDWRAASAAARAVLVVLAPIVPRLFGTRAGTGTTGRWRPSVVTRLSAEC